MEIHDVFGVEPLGQAALQVTQATIDGVSSFLNAVCKPGLEELGELLRDNIRRWRLNNILKTLEKAKGRLAFDGHELNLCANARVGLSIMESCSDVDDEELQDLWAGLFVSSCTPDGKDDSNLVFVDLLKRMSHVEARILRYACTYCQKVIFPNQLILASTFSVPFSSLVSISGIEDIQRLDYEMDHMRSIMLLNHGDLFNPGGGFSAGDKDLTADITPSPLGLNLFYKTHAINCSPRDYWRETLITQDEFELLQQGELKETN